MSIKDDIRATLWRKNNPEKAKIIQKRYEAKKRKPCPICGTKIKYPKNNVYCGQKCNLIARRKRDKDKRIKLREELNNYKCSLGCSKCEYNKCGAALDFHHHDTNKERRITVGSWKTDLGQREIAKCIILCANCHRELHHLEGL